MKSKKQTNAPVTDTDASAAAKKIAFEWKLTRQRIETQAAIRVKHWSYPYLVLIAIVLFAASSIYRELWLALIAGLTTVALSWWNKQAKVIEITPHNRED
ncbi:MAG: hypothetical protein O2971_18815 [Proteobacteria bacterium]|nr:hypothetical protein [Pseudomonadota bacterium]